MSQPPFIQRLKLKNFLSFDSVGVDVELRPLNILIGTNGSGKSNFLYAIKLLKSLPTGLWEFLREGGGIGEWLYKGDASEAVAEIEVTINLKVILPNKTVDKALRYSLDFLVQNDQLLVDKEMLLDNDKLPNFEEALYYQYNPRISFRAPFIVQIREQGEDLFDTPTPSTAHRQSVYQHTRHEFQYPVLTQTGKAFERIGIYLDLPFGKDAPYRKPQLAESFDEENLAPDGSNLAIVLNHTQTFHPDAMDEIFEKFKKLLSRTKRIQPNTTSNLIRLFVHEVMGKGKTVPISAYRLSDGTLRFLCLLVILLSPTPPPLVCIEEPEIGMHPEMLLVIAELLKEASTRTQIIVTTHSDILLSMFEPEDVLVCEHDGAKSSIKRLSAEKLKSWYEGDYALGEMWLSNAFGGVR